MTNSITLQKRILDRIKTQGVKPTAKGYFRVRDYVLWLLLGVFVAALGVGSSMVIFMARGIDRGLYAKLGLNLAQKLFYSIPFFWIIATIAVAAIAFINFRRTRKGYRLSARQIAVIVLIGGAAFGAVTYTLNVSRYIDKAVANNVPLYNAINPLNTTTWFNPEHGLLSGSVKVKSSDQSFTLRDQNFELWTIDAKGATFNPETFKFQSGDRIKLIGRKTGDLTFQAVEIRPWEIEVRREPKQAATGTPEAI